VAPGWPWISSSACSAKAWSEGDILRNYPRLTREDIVACLQYASEVLQAEKVYPLSRA
jgi:uncharacterized protein (DUF433 family)